MRLMYPLALCRKKCAPIRALILYTQKPSFVKMGFFTIFAFTICKNERNCKKTKIFKKGVDILEFLWYNTWRMKRGFENKQNPFSPYHRGAYGS